MRFRQDKRKFSYHKNLGKGKRGGGKKGWFEKSKPRPRSKRENRACMSGKKAMKGSTKKETFDMLEKARDSKKKLKHLGADKC